MERVTGIGGFFFRANDPVRLAHWYEQHLGIDQVPQSYDIEPWTQRSGATVFSPFAADTDYFGKQSQMWMLNFRVDNLQAMVAQLTGAGVDVEVDEQVYPNGHFARLEDPEGNPIQLWQPAG